MQERYHIYDNSLFSNILGFFRFPLELNPYQTNDDWVITGVPFDMTTSGRSGSRFGPMAIRQASINLAWERCRWPWKFDIRKKLKIIDCGDLVYQFGNVKNFSEKLQKHAEKLLFSGKKMLSLGGDHYITLPLLRAYTKKFGKIGIIHFDAHADYYSNGYEYDHGAFIFYAIHEGLIDPKRSIQIGVRTEFKKNYGFTIFDSEQVNELDLSVIVSKINLIVKGIPVYLTFDIDCLDPSMAPGTGTPVIAGLTTNRVLKLIRSLKSLNIIGMDIVEVTPAYDYSQITALAAATLGLEMLYIQKN